MARDLLRLTRIDIHNATGFIRAVGQEPQSLDLT